MDLSDVLVEDKVIPHSFHDLYPEEHWEAPIKESWTDWSIPHHFPGLDPQLAVMPQEKTRLPPYQFEYYADNFPILTNIENGQRMSVLRMSAVLRVYMCIHWCEYLTVYDFDVRCLTISLRCSDGNWNVHGESALGRHQAIPCRSISSRCLA